MIHALRWGASAGARRTRCGSIPSNVPMLLQIKSIWAGRRVSSVAAQTPPLTKSRASSPDFCVGAARDHRCQFSNRHWVAEALSKRRLDLFFDRHRNILPTREHEARPMRHFTGLNISDQFQNLESKRPSSGQEWLKGRSRRAGICGGRTPAFRFQAARATMIGGRRHCLRAGSNGLCSGWS